MKPVTVCEVLAGNGSDLQRVRRWAAGHTRGGDGFLVEGRRIFLVFPGVPESRGPALVQRLLRHEGSLNVRFVLCRRGEDEEIESICRRVDAGILPIQPRI